MDGPDRNGVQPQLSPEQVAELQQIERDPRVQFLIRLYVERALQAQPQPKPEPPRPTAMDLEPALPNVVVQREIPDPRLQRDPGGIGEGRDLVAMLAPPGSPSWEEVMAMRRGQVPQQQAPMQAAGQGVDIRQIIREELQSLASVQGSAYSVPHATAMPAYPSPAAAQPPPVLLPNRAPPPFAPFLPPQFGRRW